MVAYILDIELILFRQLIQCFLTSRISILPLSLSFCFFSPCLSLFILSLYLYTGELSHLLLWAPYNYTMWPPPTSTPHTNTHLNALWHGTHLYNCLSNTHTHHENKCLVWRGRRSQKIEVANMNLKGYNRNCGGRKWLKWAKRSLWWCISLHSPWPITRTGKKEFCLLR